MRILMVGVMLALMAWPAQAQMGGRRQPKEDAKTEQKPAVDEKAYKAALDRIPQPKEQYDPWGGARPGEKKADVKKPK